MISVAQHRNELRTKTLPLLRVQRFERQRALYFEGGEAESLWILRSGRVRLYKTSADGRATTLELLDPGRAFGALSALAEPLYASSAESVTAGSAWLLPRPVLLRILAEEHRTGPFRGVIHCFTASRALAEHCVGLGLYISFSGILTFRNARDIQETAKALPMERILVETDAPYLAPMPNRGKRNEPSFVAHTAAFLAQLRGEATDTVAEATTANFFRLFSKVPRTLADAA